MVEIRPVTLSDYQVVSDSMTVLCRHSDGSASWLKVGSLPELSALEKNGHEIKQIESLKDDQLFNQLKIHSKLHIYYLRSPDGFSITKTVRTKPFKKTPENLVYHEIVQERVSPTHGQLHASAHRLEK